MKWPLILIKIKVKGTYFAINEENLSTCGQGARKKVTQSAPIDKMFEMHIFTLRLVH